MITQDKAANLLPLSNQTLIGHTFNIILAICRSSLAVGICI